MTWFIEHLSPALVAVLFTIAALPYAVLCGLALTWWIERTGQRLGTVVPFRSPSPYCSTCGRPVSFGADGCVLGHRDDAGEFCAGSGDWP